MLYVFFWQLFCCSLYYLIFGFQKIIRKEKNIKKNNFLFFIFYFLLHYKNFYSMFSSREILGKEKNVKENDFLMILLWKNIKEN